MALYKFMYYYDYYSDNNFYNAESLKFLMKFIMLYNRGLIYMYVVRGPSCRPRRLSAPRNDRAHSQLPRVDVRQSFYVDVRCVKATLHLNEQKFTSKGCHVIRIWEHPN